MIAGVKIVFSFVFRKVLSRHQIVFLRSAELDLLLLEPPSYDQCDSAPLN